MDDPMQASFGADYEIEQRLERYALVRLTPSSATAARLRARVMRDTRLAIAEGNFRPAATIAALETARSARRRAAVRRVAGLGLAAVLSLVAVGGVLAAGRAGGPLYDARIWFESLTLPSDAAARASAEISRLEDRLDEVLAAAASGDSRAVMDALAAYQAIADEALLGAAGNAAALEQIQLALGRHLAVLDRIASTVPDHAADVIAANIARAIAHTNAAIERMQNQPSGSDGAPKPAVAPAHRTEDEPADKTAKPVTKTPKPAAVGSTPTPTSRPADAAPTPSRPAQGPPSTKPGKSPPAGDHGQP
jgi:hypothetical protein